MSIRLLLVVLMYVIWLVGWWYVLGVWEKRSLKLMSILALYPLGAGLLVRGLLTLRKKKK